MTSKGFTLIEMAVGVLIIGILTAIAVPYYQNAVESARNTEVSVWWGQLHRGNAGKYMTQARAERYEREINEKGKLKYFTISFFCREKENTEESCWELELHPKDTNQHIQYFWATQKNMQELVCVPVNSAGENFCQSQAVHEDAPDAEIEGQSGYVVRH